MTTNYDTDFYTWTQEQAALLRAGALGEMDLANLAEEIESLGKSEKSALYSHLEVVLTHLLKLQLASERRPYSLERAGRGWRGSVRRGRLRLAKILRENPGLQPHVGGELAEAYVVARSEATEALDIDDATAPAACPWTVDQVLDDDFWPEHRV